MAAETLHLRARKGGPLCGARGSSVYVTSIEWLLRQRSRRCDRCLRIALAHLETLARRPRRS